MARPRTPLAKAKVTGQDKRHSERFKGRKEPPPRGPLGDPPNWMKKPGQIEAWNTFADELFWLDRSHRAIVSIAADIRGRQIAGEEMDVKAYTLLRQCLGQMGATPADASKVQMPDDDTPDDPSAKYF
jgi:hypothetical protein